MDQKGKSLLHEVQCLKFEYWSNEKKCFAFLKIHKMSHKDAWSIMNERGGKESDSAKGIEKVEVEQMMENRLIGLRKTAQFPVSGSFLWV